MDDDTPHAISGAYEIGRLHGRVSALEKRVDKQETILAAIDSKLDQVLLDLSSAMGGRKKVSSMLKCSLGIVSALGACGGAIAAFYHFLIGAH